MAKHFKCSLNIITCLTFFLSLFLISCKTDISTSNTQDSKSEQKQDSKKTDTKKEDKSKDTKTEKSKKK